MKKLNERGIKARTLHDSFLWMLNASIDFSEKWDAGEIIGKYWFYAFQNSPLTEEDFNDLLIDRIRKQLLVVSGVTNPILTENTLTKKIKSNLIFSEE